MVWLVLHRYNSCHKEKCEKLEEVNSSNIILVILIGLVVFGIILGSAGIKIYRDIKNNKVDNKSNETKECIENVV